jgi:hypothetical protein
MLRTAPSVSVHVIVPLTLFICLCSNCYLLFLLYSEVHKLYYPSIISLNLFILVLKGIVVYDSAVWFLKRQELIKINQYSIVIVVLRSQYNLIVKLPLMKSSWFKLMPEVVVHHPWYLVVVCT